MRVLGDADGGVGSYRGVLVRRGVRRQLVARLWSLGSLLVGVFGQREGSGAVATSRFTVLGEVRRL